MNCWQDYKNPAKEDSAVAMSLIRQLKVKNNKLISYLVDSYKELRKQCLEIKDFNQNITLPADLFELNIKFSSENQWHLDLLEDNQEFVFNICYQTALNLCLKLL